MKKIVLWTTFFVSLIMMILTIIVNSKDMIFERVSLFLFCGTFLIASAMELNLFNLKHKIPLVRSDCKWKHILFWTIVFCISVIVLCIPMSIQDTLKSNNETEKEVVTLEVTVAPTNNNDVMELQHSTPMPTIQPKETIDPIKTPFVLETEMPEKKNDKELDKKGSLYTIERIFDMGQTTIFIRNIKAKAHGYQYYFTIEYDITNNTNEDVKWKMHKNNSGNMVGKIDAGFDRSYDMGGNTISIKNDDDYDPKYTPMDGSTLKGKEKISGSIKCIWGSVGKTEGLKENTPMSITMYYNQNGVDTEFCIDLN